MEEKDQNKIYDCSRGCEVERTAHGALRTSYNPGCCKLSDFDWMQGISQERYKDLFEVRFKNTRKIIYKNTSGQLIKTGDLVVVEAPTGHDVGIVTLEGPVVVRQLMRHNTDPSTYEFRRIYRRAKILDIERWQEAIAREHKTMIRARQIAAGLGLDMKIGDVEFQGDGTKAIFYYIADERVDFRQLIKDFAEEFHIRIEMKQIGARQEAGLIGGIGVCGRALCCSAYMSDFKSITTQAARCQDLSLNPQKLAGQCSKLKCCINYEASLYIDAQKHFPDLRGPLEFKDGNAYLQKCDILKGIMYFSYEPHSMINLFPLSGQRVRDIMAMNRKGIKPDSLKDKESELHETDFVSAVGDDSISRFDEKRRPKRKKQQKRFDKSRQQRSEDEKPRQEDDNKVRLEGNKEGQNKGYRRQGQRGGGRRRDQGKPREKGGEKRESSENQ
jgi:cell fate regulator YaaT (PSP1 superfamily)